MAVPDTSDPQQSNRIICVGGLNSSQNYLDLSTNQPGAATRLINYEVGLSGGYRRVNGYAPFDPTFAEVGVGVAEGKVLGVYIFDNTVTGITMFIAARKDVGAATYSFYDYQSGTGWVKITTGLTHNYTVGGSTVDKLRFAVGNDGTKNYMAVVDGVNNALLFDGTSWGFIKSTNGGTAISDGGGDQAIDAPFLVAFFSSTLFLACDLMNGFTGLTVYSAPNAFFDFTDANGGGQAPAGTEIVDMKPFRSNLYVFGFNAIKKLVADTTSGFLQSDVTTNIGCISRDSVIEIGGDLIFLAPDGFRPVTGTDKIGDVELESISKQIHELISQRVTAVAGTAINSVVIRGKSQFRYFFGDDSFDANDSRGIIGGLRTADQTLGWEFGELLGFRTSCCFSKYVLGTEYVIHGDYDGIVYKQEFGNDLNGSDMTSVYSTPYLDLGDTQVRKIIKSVTTFLNGEGDLGLSLSVNYDWGRAEVPSPAAYPITLEAIIPFFDSPTSVYNTTLFGGILTPVFVEDIEGSFFSARFTYTASGTEPPHSIHAIIVEYTVGGRR